LSRRKIRYFYQSQSSRNTTPMKPPYFIETLARNGEVLSRQRVAGLPILLGRGYDNDCILDDAHIGARHAVIEPDADGRLILRDLGSKNGVVWRGRRHASVALEPDTVVRLGQTHLRVRGADCPVPAELADTSSYAWEGARPALAGLALIGAGAVLSNWLGSVEAFDPVRYLLVIASAIGGGLFWCAIWAFGNRLFARHARLGRHLFILGCGLISMEAWKIASSVVAYAYSFEPLTRYGNHVIIAIACGMIVFHLRTIVPRQGRRLAWTGLVLALLGSALNLMGNMQLAGRLADEPYMALLLPPALRHSPDHTPDEFFARVAALKNDVDAARALAFQRPDPSGADVDEEQ
jgi:hypothetical protein